MLTFVWPPDKGAEVEREPKIRSVIFGEGYEQNAPAGINNDMRLRKLTFSGRSAAEMQSISDFLESHGAVTRFLYTHPGDSQRIYICKKWKIQDVDYLVLSVTAEFKQVPL